MVFPMYSRIIDRFLLQDVYASLFFRAQRIFLHNARGWFGDIPLEASGDFGIDPEQGEYHVMCQVYQCLCQQKQC